MTILKLKNSTNIYRIDVKKLGGSDDTLLSRSTDQIKVFKVQYADSCGRAKWEEKKSDREEKEEEEGSDSKVGRRVKTQARRQDIYLQARRQ